MLTEKIISQADYDTAVAGHRQAKAQADNIRATIAKKTIRAPFSGRLGIRQVNLGQILREGDPIVTLQSLDPIYVDFTLPQQELSRLHARPSGAGDQRCPAGRDDQGPDHHHQPAGGRRYPQHQGAGNGGQPGGKAPPRHVRQRGGRPPGPAEGAGHSGHVRPLRPLRRLGLRRRRRQCGARAARRCASSSCDSARSAATSSPSPTG